MKHSVIIIGAGAAGLMAARKLSEKKISVTVLESRSATGGRIQTHRLPDGSGVVEGGAEFIHGKLPVTLSLCDEAGIAYLPMEGKMYRKDKNDLVEENEMIEGWDELIKKMGSVKEDMTVSGFLDKYYSEDRYTLLRMHMISYVQGFDVADPEKASIKALYREWSHEEEEVFRIPEGYQALIGYLEKKCLENGCVIVRGDAVRQVDWQNGDATAYAASGKKYSAERIIVTVPVSILSDIAGPCSINFTPPIDRYINAASQIGFGAVIRIVIQFNDRFWKEDAQFIFSDETIPTWWTQLPLNNAVLTGWAGGPRATQLSRHTDDELLAIAVASLSGIFGMSLAEIRSRIVHSYVFNWLDHPEALGAYSYSMVSTTEALKTFSQPVDETVFFAGECFYEGDSPGTVEAALVSGANVAKRIIAL